MLSGAKLLRFTLLLKVNVWCVLPANYEIAGCSRGKERHFIVSRRINHTWGSTDVSKKQCRKDFSGRLLDINRKVFFQVFLDINERYSIAFVTLVFTPAFTPRSKRGVCWN